MGNKEGTPAKTAATELLKRWSDGDGEALNKLIPLVHDELRRRAHAQMRKERPGHTLQTTALVNEAYMRLVGAQEVSWQNRAHFLAVAAEQMRRILVDWARAKACEIRGGKLQPVSMDEGMAIWLDRPEDLIALDEALTRLSEAAPRKGRVVALRYFGGLSVKETAEVMQVSPETVKLDWRFARAWLHRELS